MMKNQVPKTKSGLRTALLALAILPLTAYAQFPNPYCTLGYPDGVEPITLVNFAGINNTTSASGTSEHEDFTAQTGNVIAGGSYTFTAKGNTAGSWTNYIRVYVDWNQNNSFADPGESFDIGTINSSSGTDAIQASASIAVPAGATLGSTRMRVTKRFGQYGADCGSVGDFLDYGQAEDYTLVVSAAASVDSVVVTTQGNVPATITTNAGTLQLAATVYPTAGSQTVIWSLTPAGGTASISPSGLVTAITNGNVWAKATSAANSAYSDSILISMSNQNPPFPLPYCNTTYPEDVEPITSVVFAGINNTSPATVNGSPELEDFTSQTATVSQGSSYPISVKGNTAGAYTNYIRVYIDWNQNNSFTDPGESYNIGSIYNSSGTDAIVANGTIAVPAGATLGNTRMRVTKRFFDYAPPCGALGDGDDFGQAEDYTVNVIAPTTVDSVVVATQGGVPATITTNAGTLQMTATVYPALVNQAVTWSITPGTGTASINTSGLVTAISNGTVWAKAISVVNSSAMDSLQITISNQLPPFPLPYCNTDYDDGVEPITLVNFAGINNPSSATVNGSPALENFTAISASVTQGQSYPISVKGNTDGNWTNYIRVYIDWNQNNSLSDPGESYDLGTIVNSTGLDAIQATGTIAVPANAVAGTTRMRVVKRFGAYAPDCGMIGNAVDYGQAEDYSVNVTALAGIDSVVVSTQGGVPAAITTNAGTLQLVATVYPVLANQAVTWSITPVSGAATINASGLVSAQSNGDVWAKAVSVQDASKSDSLLINISGQIVPIDSVVVSTQGAVPAEIGSPSGTLQLVATVYPAAANQAVTWSLNPVSGAAAIDANGLVTAQSDGTVWAKAVSVEDPSKSDSILVTISGQPIPVDSVVVSTQGGVPAAITTNAGNLQLVATVYPALVSQAVTWSIIPVSGSANIDASGLVSAVNNGTVWAKAISVEDPSKSDSILITISNQGIGLEGFNAISLELFPNPAEDLVNLRMPESGTIYNMEILSADGRVVSLKRSTGSAIESVDVSFLRPGVYTMRIYTTSGSGATVKFVKK